jgi:predicted Ser/Thr protein kinase
MDGEFVQLPEDKPAMAVRLGEYLLERRIGSGGMGQVFLGRQESLDRMVAIKIMPRQTASDQQSVQRFQREAKSIAQLIHPNIIQVFSFGVEKGVPYFAMEYVNGEDLSARLKKGEEFTTEEVVRIFIEVARALEAAAAHDIVHRDIKPSNIMIAGTGEVKVMDFGLAKTLKKQSDVTTVGMVLGTPQYMSPEQGKGEALDPRADMYSLGCVVYQLLTGSPPFEADTPTAMVYMHIHEEPKPVQELNPDVPNKLAAIVMRCLKKDPDRRFADPCMLKNMLESLQRGETTAKMMECLDAEQPPGEELPRPEPAGVRDTGGGGGVWVAVFGAVGLFIAVAVFALILFRHELFGTRGDTGTGRQEPVVARVLDPGMLGEPPCEIFFPGDKLKEHYGDRANAVLIAENKKSAPFRLENRLLCAGRYRLCIEREGFDSLTIGPFELRLLDNTNSIDFNNLSLLELSKDTVNEIGKAVALFEDGRYLDAEMCFGEIEKYAPDMPVGQFANASEAVGACKQEAKGSKAYADLRADGQSKLGDAKPQEALKILMRIPKESTFCRKHDIAGLIRDAKEKTNTAQMFLVDAKKELCNGRFDEVRALGKKAEALDRDLAEAGEILARCDRAAEFREKARSAFGERDNRNAVTCYRKYLEIATGDKKVRAIFERLEKKVKAEDARQDEIKSRCGVAKKALDEKRPADAIIEYDYILANLEPHKMEVPHIKYLRAYAVRNGKKLGIEKTLAELDKAYMSRDPKAVLALLTAEAKEGAAVREDIEVFLKEAGAVKLSRHDIQSLTLEDGKEAAITRWVFSVFFTGVPEPADGSIAMTYRFTDSGNRWKIAAVTPGD